MATTLVLALVIIFGAALWWGLNSPERCFRECDEFNRRAEADGDLAQCVCR